jgi:hypothetical protein
MRQGATGFKSGVWRSWRIGRRDLQGALKPETATLASPGGARITRWACVGTRIHAASTSVARHTDEKFLELSHLSVGFWSNRGFSTPTLVLELGPKSKRLWRRVPVGLSFAVFIGTPAHGTTARSTKQRKASSQFDWLDGWCKVFLVTGGLDRYATGW